MNWTRVPFVILTGIAAILTGGCRTNPVAVDGAANQEIQERKSAFQGFVLVRSHDDVVKIDGQDVRQLVEYGWDYNQGIAVRRIYDTGGKLMAADQMPGLTLNLTASEKAHVFALVRSHPDLTAAVAQPGVVLYGGFSYMEQDDPKCSRRSRCVHVMASKDGGAVVVAHAIVDLMTNRVVYPRYDGQLRSAN